MNNNCYLIAFNQQLRKININQQMLDISSDEARKLKYIDSLTSPLEEKEFREYLFKKGIIESIDTPICIVDEYKKYDNTKDINIFRIITKGNNNEKLDNDYKLLEDFQTLYYTNKDYQEIANFIIGQDEIKRIFFFNGYNGRKYKLDYYNVRNIVLSLNVFDKYKKLDNTPEKDYDYMAHKDEIISLLSSRSNI